MVIKNCVFFEYAINPDVLDFWGGILVDIHDRLKLMDVYQDGHMLRSKIMTFLMICVTCVGTRNKKHLEFNAKRMVIYPITFGVILMFFSVWVFNRHWNPTFFTLHSSTWIYFAMVIKNLENKIKLVLIICSLFLVGCVVISLGSIWTARGMVSDAHQKVYVLDGNVPVLVNRSTMEETLDVEAKSHVEMFHHYFFTLAPDDKYIKYTMEKAMYLIDETGLAQYNALKET